MGIYKPANRGRHSLVDLEPCKKFINVPVRRLDELLKDSAVKSWTLMKMDVEGFEPFAFAGGAETLARTESLALEYAPAYWKKSNIEPAAVFQTLSAYFSRIDRFYDLDPSPSPRPNVAKAKSPWTYCFAANAPHSTPLLQGFSCRGAAGSAPACPGVRCRPPFRTYPNSFATRASRCYRSSH
jgi:hypothetical protein